MNVFSTIQGTSQEMFLQTHRLKNHVMLATLHHLISSVVSYCIGCSVHAFNQT